MKLRPLFLCVLLGNSLASAVPPPEVRVVTDDYHGVKVEDPYRYFEEPGNAEVAAWSKALAAKSASRLSALAKRDRIAEFIRQAEEGKGDEVGKILRRPDETLYFLMMKQGYPINLLYRKRPHQQAELVLDPRKVVDGGEAPATIKYFNVSPDGRALVACITAGGGENGELYIFDLKDGRTIGGPIDRTRWFNAYWLPDSSGFIYNRLQKLGPDAAPREAFQRSIVYLHKLGSDASRDVPVFGIGVNERVSVQPEDLSIVMTIPGSEWAVALNEDGVSARFILHLAKLDDLIAGKPKWRELCDRDDLVGAMSGNCLAIHHQHLFLLTRKNAPNGRIVKVDLETLDLEAATTIYTPERGVIQEFHGTGDGLYVRLLDGGPSRLLRLPYQSLDTPQPITTPEQGRISLHGGLSVDPRQRGVMFTLSSWTRPPRHFAVGPDDTAAYPLTLAEETLPAICDELLSRQIMLPSYDGTMIPVSLVYRKDLDLGKPHPVMLNGYGAYGTTIQPRFYPSDAGLCGMGAIKAVAHVRGSGAFGETWRLAGYQATKPNTWKDLIAVAEGLVKEGYTTPGQIALHGRSAGGIAVGRAITEKPGAFGAALIGVGLSDALRMETTANGVPNISEFGSTKTPAGFAALHAMSPYHHIKDGVSYPSTLLYHGANDTRVKLWHSQKMAARLMAANDGGNPVLLRIDYHTGHGGGTSRDQWNELYTDLLAFFFAHCGSPE